MVLKTILVALLLAPASSVPSDWETKGRALPTVEQQTTDLDEKLVEYRPCVANVGGVRKGSVTTILPQLFERWSYGFGTHHPEAAIISAPPYGPPQGRLSIKLAEFLSGKSSFALVSRSLTDADLATFRQTHGRNPIVIPVATGSWRHFGFVDTLVVIVNDDNPLERISFAEIDAIFSSTRLRGHQEIRDWEALGNIGWQGRKVRPVGAATWRDEDSARSAVIRQKVLNGGAWRSDLGNGGDEAAAIHLVASNPDAIAITGLGHVGPGVRALSISAGEEFVAPSFKNVSLNRYPLSRTIDLLLAPDAEGKMDPLMNEFARYVLSRAGQQKVAEQGVFLPLRSEQAIASRALLQPCESP